MGTGDTFEGFQFFSDTTGYFFIGQEFPDARLVQSEYLFPESFRFEQYPDLVFVKSGTLNELVGNLVLIAVNPVKSLSLAKIADYLSGFFQLGLKFTNLSLERGIAVDCFSGGNTGKEVLTGRGRFHVEVSIVGAVFREITRTVLVFGGGEFLAGDIVSHLEDKSSGIIQSYRVAGETATRRIGAKVVESEFFHGKLPGLLGGQLVNGQLEVILKIIGGKEFLVGLIIDDGQTAAFQLVHSIDKAPQLDTLDIYIEASFQGYRQVEIGAVNLPESGKYLFAVFLVLLLFFRRFVPLGQPVLLILR